MEAEHIAEILDVYRNYESVEGRARVVSLEDIEGHDWNLNIPRYVESVSDVSQTSVADALDNLKTSLAQAEESENKLKSLLRESGLLVFQKGSGE